MLNLFIFTLFIFKNYALYKKAGIITILRKKNIFSSVYRIFHINGVEEIINFYVRLPGHLAIY